MLDHLPASTSTILAAVTATTAASEGAGDCASATPGRQARPSNRPLSMRCIEDSPGLHARAACPAPPS
jgi:hypothetical protein